MKILITGGAGFIGSNLARYLKEQGHYVAVLDRDFEKHPMRDIEMAWKVDLTDYSESTNVNMIFDSFRPDVCFHLAAYASEGRSNHIREYITRNNTLTTMRVINYCVKYNIRLVFTSSVAVFSGESGFGDFSVPNPIDEYGLSKWMSEKSIEIASLTQHLDYTIIRPRNVYGQGQNLWDPSRNLFGIWMYNALHEKDCLIYGSGNQVRQFTYIDDLIPCLGAAGINQIELPAINLGSSRAYTINEAMEAFMTVTGYKRFVHVGARHEVKNAKCTTGFAERYLGWNVKKETPLIDGLTRMWAWAQIQPDRPLDHMPPLEVLTNAHSSLI